MYYGGWHWFKVKLNNPIWGPFNRRVRFYIDTIRLVLSEDGLNYSNNIVHTLNGFIFVELSL